MTFELDHVFIMSSVDAPEGARLRHLGIPEGPPNKHPGQGTACRRFIFRNAYLELLWVCDENEAQRKNIRKTQLWDRWVERDGDACPFGVILRSTGDDVGPPFEAWEYRPSYLPAPLAIHVAREVPLTEPAFFYLPFQRSPAQLGPEEADPREAAAAITRVTIGGPVIARSAAAQIVHTAGWFSTQGPERQQVMMLQLDEGRRGVVADLRPDLPLVLQW